MSVTTTRAPVRALRQSPSAVASAASAEKARKKASKAALRAAIEAQNAATFGAQPEAPKPAPKPDHSAEDRANALAAAAVDAEALGTTLAEQLEAMGIDATGAPKAPERVLSAGTLSMLPLRTAALHYKRGVHCDDGLAAAFDSCTAAQTIAILGKLLLAKEVTTSSNPYLHLNPGQQSMNLRNKCRGAIKNGMVQLAEVVEAIRLHMVPAQ